MLCIYNWHEVYAYTFNILWYIMGFLVAVELGKCVQSNVKISKFNSNQHDVYSVQCKENMAVVMETVYYDDDTHKIVENMFV